MYTVNDSWAITNTDKDLGIISASQMVSFGEGKTVPLNIGFEPKGASVNVSMTYSTSGGVTAPLESIQKYFCSTVEKVNREGSTDSQSYYDWLSVVRSKKELD